MKVEHIKITGFEETLRGMRNPYDSWAKSDSYIVPNISPCTPEYHEKLEKFPVGLNSMSYSVMDKDPSNINEKEVILYEPWYQQYFFDKSRIDTEKYDHESLTIETDKVALIGKNDIDLMQRLISSDCGAVNGGEPNQKFLRYPMITMDITASFDFWKEFDTYKVGTVADSCSTMHTITKHPLTIANFSTYDLRPQDIEKIESLWIPVLNDIIKDSSITDLEKTRILSKMNLTGFEQKRTIKLNYENMHNMSIWRAGHKLKEWRKLVNVYFKNMPYYKVLFDNNHYLTRKKEALASLNK